jgi:hypothetical protein
MKYSKPELVVVGSATALVKGIPGETGDNPNPFTEHVAEGVHVGLDD